MWCECCNNMSVFIIKEERYQVYDTKTKKLVVAAESLTALVEGIITAKKKGRIDSGLGGVFLRDETVNVEECNEFWKLYNIKIDSYLIEISKGLES